MDKFHQKPALLKLTYVSIHICISLFPWSVGLCYTECSRCISTWLFPPPPARNKVFSSDLHCENLKEGS